jgi:predicted ferric reductase
MSILSPTQNNGAARRSTRQSTSTWFWLVLAVAAVTGITVAIMPGLLPALSGSLTGESAHGFWYISRASAFVAYVLIWMSMMAGLGITGKAARKRPGMSLTYEIHRYAGLLGLGFASLHALVLLGDAYINYSITQLLVPFMGSNYMPEWVGFGQVAIYLTAIVSLSFYVRDRIGLMGWRLIHMLSFALFLMAMIHGMQSGTDSKDLWAQALYWGSAATILAGTIYRIVAVRIGRHKQTLEGSGLVAHSGRSQRQLVRPTALQGRPAFAQQTQAVPLVRPILTRTNTTTRN